MPDSPSLLSVAAMVTATGYIIAKEVVSPLVRRVVGKGNPNGNSPKCHASETLRDHRDEILPIMNKQTDILAELSRTLAVVADRTARR